MSGIRLTAQLLVFAGLAMLSADRPASAQSASAANVGQLVVVELFQSQGCSSCPPAEANLNALAGRPDVLALSYGVTYWDGLGWKDTFAKPQFTDRQWDYARHRGRNNVWTPQAYIDGQVDLVGVNRAELDAAISHASSVGPALSWSPGQLKIDASGQKVASDVWLVRYDPRTLDVPIGAGENGGRLLPQRNVVRELIRLGPWDGSAASFALPAASQPGLATAAFVQAIEGGAILSAIKQ